MPTPIRLSVCALAVLLVTSLAIIQVPHVSASAPPLAAFTYEPCLACAVPGFATFFNANGSASPTGLIVSYTWDFGDGSPIVTTTNPAISHLSMSSTKSNVTLTVKDSNGLTGTTVQPFIWNIVPRFTFNPTMPGTNQPVLFNATSSHDYTGVSTILGYDWKFGDGTTGNGVLAKHAYASPGLYRISLALATSQNSNLNASPTVSKTIRVGIQPQGQLLNTTFDGFNITVFGSFTVNSTARTITGHATVIVTNATTGALIFSKTFNVMFTYRQGEQIRFVLVASISPLNLGISCTTDQTSSTTRCMVSRSPDVDDDGDIGIIDFGVLAARFGQLEGSPGYMPATDLAARGSIDIIDLGIMLADYNVPVYR